MRQRHHADLGFLAVRAALALDPELALLPEDVLRGEAAQLADAEPGVEQGPDNKPFGGRLAGVGQTIRLGGGEWFSRVLIRHLPPRNSCVFGDGPRSRCAFQLPGYPDRGRRGSGLRPRKPGETPLRASSGVEGRCAAIGGAPRTESTPQVRRKSQATSDHPHSILKKNTARLPYA